jgi:hypothetical protein
MINAGTLCDASENSRLVRSMKSLASSTENAGPIEAIKRELLTLISDLFSEPGIIFCVGMWAFYPSY